MKSLTTVLLCAVGITLAGLLDGTNAFAFRPTRLNYINGVDETYVDRSTRTVEEQCQDIYYQGRIEPAFDYAKINGEAAFVTYITAGYPSQAGKQSAGR